MNLLPDAEYYIEKLGLQPHPEGGWYKEIYRSHEKVAGEYLPKRFSGDRSFGTSIYFLLQDPAFSAFHRIKSEEIWHFYAGGAIVIYSIDSHGVLREALLGNDLGQGQSFQVVIPAGHWFAAKLKTHGTFALAGCTVAPGFDFHDFEMGKKDELLAFFPWHQEVIQSLTLPG